MTDFHYGFIAGAVTALLAALGAIYGTHLERTTKKKRRHTKQRLEFDPKRTFIQR